MAIPDPTQYVGFVRPKAGDSTHTLLKAHLLFEEMLRAFVDETVPSPSALKGSRLSFGQVLALVRALCRPDQQDHWCWKAIGDLNKLRNVLAHEAEPGELEAKQLAFVNYVIEKTGRPLPATNFPASLDGTPQAAALGYRFSAVDMVAISLYFSTATLLGFSPPTVPPP